MYTYKVYLIKQIIQLFYFIQLSFFQVLSLFFMRDIITSR